MKNPSKANELGFTLIEITLAILMLGGALTVFLGLQTAAVQKALRDKQQFKAMLLARSLMSGIELNNNNIDEQETIKSAYDRLEELNIPVDEKEENQYDRFETILKVEKILIPLPIPDPSGLPQDIEMKKFVLTLTWGDNPEDTFDITYFSPL